jgi:hypothetical protein
VGPRAGLEDVEKRKFLTLPAFELRPLRRPARTDDIPAHKEVLGKANRILFFDTTRTSQKTKGGGDTDGTQLRNDRGKTHTERTCHKRHMPKKLRDTQYAQTDRQYGDLIRIKN